MSRRVLGLPIVITRLERLLQTESVIMVLLLSGLLPHDSCRALASTFLKLVLLVMAQKPYFDVLGAHSVNVVLSSLTLRVIVRKQQCDVSREQCETGIDTSTNFAREIVKPGSLLVPCYAHSGHLRVEA